MAHDVEWHTPELILYANYKGHQTEDTIRACLDDMANALDTVSRPVIVLINWLEVTEHDPKALLNL